MSNFREQTMIWYLGFNGMIKLYFQGGALCLGRILQIPQQQFVRKDPGFPKDGRFAIRKNRFHTTEFTRSDQNMQRQQNKMVGSVDGLCEMYEQSYCSLFDDTIHVVFVFFMLTPQKRHYLYRLRHRVASIQFHGCCCAIGRSF